MAGRRMRCPNCGGEIPVARPDQEPPRRKPARTRPTQASEDEEDGGSEPVKLTVDHEASDSDMDMTPMVDVTFLLLIFFMVTAAFSLQKSLEIPKPKQDEPSTVTEQQDPEDDPTYVTVFVDEFNTYRVVTVDWDIEAPSDQELLRKLREARNGDSAGNVPTKLLVKAHGDSLHEKVVAALDAGTEVGMEQVQLMTVEESE
jgi:biopolymer transport protein ExbD